jgi:hypothetical protein
LQNNSPEKNHSVRRSPRLNHSPVFNPIHPELGPKAGITRKQGYFTDMDLHGFLQKRLSHQTHGFFTANRQSSDGLKRTGPNFHKGLPLSVERSLTKSPRSHLVRISPPFNVKKAGKENGPTETNPGTLEPKNISQGIQYSGNLNA